MTTTKWELLPCPWCNSKPLLNRIKTTLGVFWTVKCNSKKCEMLLVWTRTYGNKSEAITAWNTRKETYDHRRT